MAKGCWIAHVDITDPEKYKEYVRLNGIAFSRYGAKFVVRSGTSEARKGSLKPRHVIIEFANFAQAKACYDSLEYQVAIKVRDTACTVDLVIVEGYDA